jgi:hypothetical protein
MLWAFMFLVKLYAIIRVSRIGFIQFYICWRWYIYFQAKNGFKYFRLFVEFFNCFYCKLEQLLILLQGKRCLLVRGTITLNFMSFWQRHYILKYIIATADDVMFFCSCNIVIVSNQKAVKCKIMGWIKTPTNIVLNDSLASYFVGCSVSK